jgi:hypothetical protein
MIRPLNILASLRRRRASIGRFILALFAFASVAIGAAPCLAMAVQMNVPIIHHGDVPSASHEHSHMGAHGDGGAMGEHVSQHSPERCPHCPLSAGMPGHDSSGSHSSCSALDDVADYAQPSTSLPSVKYVLPAPVLEISATRLFRPPDAAAARLRGPAYSSVALNVRHCVFLI